MRDHEQRAQGRQGVQRPSRVQGSQPCLVGQSANLLAVNPISSDRSKHI